MPPFVIHPCTAAVDALAVNGHPVTTALRVPLPGVRPATRELEVTR